MKQALNHLLHVLLPNSCLACKGILKDGELTVCTDCRHDLPVTNAHFTNSKLLHKVLYGRAEIKLGTALFRYEKNSSVQELIHNLKYKGMEQVGTLLGQWLGAELNSIPDYRTVDCVIPVPLHPKKLKKRGFNQVSEFGKEIAMALNCDFNDTVLIKKTNTISQVRKNRYFRWNSQLPELFSLNAAEAIKNKHVLLVDDIITTGATLERCINVLNQGQPKSISLATMAIA